MCVHASFAVFLFACHISCSMAHGPVFVRVCDSLSVFFVAPSLSLFLSLSHSLSLSLSLFLSFSLSLSMCCAHARQRLQCCARPAVKLLVLWVLAYGAVCPAARAPREKCKASHKLSAAEYVSAGAEFFETVIYAHIPTNWQQLNLKSMQHDLASAHAYLLETCIRSCIHARTHSHTHAYTCRTKWLWQLVASSSRPTTPTVLCRK